MNKKRIVPVLLGIGAAALVTEVAVHGYLDIMYAEKIPQGIIKRIMNRKTENDYNAFSEYTSKSVEWIEKQDIEIVDMISERGYNLKGYLLMSEHESKTFVLFAHGYRADHLGDPANFEKYYHDKGYNFMSVDHTASGDSGGDFVGFDYFESDDMLSWIDYLVERFGSDISIILHGVSLGGATVCQCASRVPAQVRAIISDCAYTSACDEFLNVVESAGIRKAAPFLIKAFNVLNKCLAGYDLNQTDVRESVKNTRVPMLFVHGDEDDFVPTSMVYELYEICGGEKELLIIEGAEHAQSIMVGTDKYLSKVDEFLDGVDLEMDFCQK